MEETRPRIMEFKNGILLILRSIGSAKEPDDMASIRLWIDDSRVISLQKMHFIPAFNLAKNLEVGKQIVNSGEFLYNLIYEILNLADPAIIGLNEDIDVIEDKVLKTHNSELREDILRIRRNTTIFKRYFLPQKDVIAMLKSIDYVWISEWARRHFQENYDQITRMIEEIDEARERSQIVHDELSNAIADRLNNNMFKLSIITSVFLPLSFIAGLFGMNVGGVPFSSNEMGFYICTGAMCSAFYGLFYFFKKRKLF
jgi:zinc transporter